MLFRNHVHSLVWAYRHISGKLYVPELKFIAPFLSSDSVCIDVGANAGAWSIGLARLVDAGHVFSFEALPYYAKVLTGTLKWLRVRNVTILNRAVTENEEVVQMVDKGSDGECLIGKVHVAVKNELKTDMVSIQGQSLDAFWAEINEQQVDFIKCDIEGFELFALRGATRLVERCLPVFYSELNLEWCERYGYVPQDVFDFFKRFDYVAYYIDLERGLVPVDTTMHVNRDVLFVPETRAIPSGMLKR